MNKNRIFSVVSPILNILSIVVMLAIFGASYTPAEAGAQGTRNLATPELIRQAQEAGQIDVDTANLYFAYALADYEKLPQEFRSDAPWEGTLPLLDLTEALSVNSAGIYQNEITDVLAAGGACDFANVALPSVSNSAHFHIQYGAIGGGLSISNYSTSLETTWTKEISTFGWAAPPVLAGNPPPGNRYHVRIDNLGGGLYGFVAASGVHAGFVGNNPNTAWNDVDAFASCMVLNSDFSGFPGSAQQALDATTAHEFNHSIQFGYGVLAGANRPDDIFVEGGATWMEDEVFDTANDNYNYLWPIFSLPMGNYTDPFPYPYWITFRGITERYGTGSAGAGEQVMQDFWEILSKGSSGNGVTALNTALASRSTNLNKAFHAYAIAVKFNKPCGGSVITPYCFEEAAGYLASAGATPSTGSIASVGNSYTGSIADNYSINWINLPTGGSTYGLTLRNTSAGGSLRGSIVCNKGAGVALSITAFPLDVGAGARTSLGEFNSTGCSSVVAVITNQSTATLSTSRSYTLSTCATNTDVTIGVTSVGNYCVPSQQSISDRYAINGGPVNVTSTTNVFTSQRAIFGSSFNSIVGYPANQLTTDYWFTSYDDVGMITFLVIGNPHPTLTAQVDVYIGGVKKNVTPYSIPPGQRTALRYGINGGPVFVDGINGVNIFTSERTKFGDTFNEVMGYPANQLTTDYWFTSYDDVGMTTFLVIGNPHPSNTALVDVYIAGVKKNTTPYSIAPGQRIFPRYATNGGPVFVDGINGVNIFTSERSKFGGSFNEVMGYPANQLTTDYWFTSYDDAGMITYLVIGNPHPSSTAQVDVYIAGVKKNTSPYSIAPGQRVFLRYGINNGPVHVDGTNGVNVFASERTKYLSSFNEIMGFAHNQLTNDYWFTSLDDVGMITNLVISAP